MLQKTMRGLALATALSIPNVYAKQTDSLFFGFDVQDNFTRLSKEASTAKINDHAINREMVAATALAGFRWSKFGFEIGKTFFNRKTYYGNRQNKVKKCDNIYVDGHYYYNLAHMLELKVLLGYGRLTTSFSGTATVVGTSIISGNNVNQKFYSNGLRLGAGLQFNMTNYVSGSLMYKHQKGNNIYKSVNTAAVGITFNF